MHHWHHDLRTAAWQLVHLKVRCLVSWRLVSRGPETYTVLPHDPLAEDIGRFLSLWKRQYFERHTDHTWTFLLNSLWSLLVHFARSFNFLFYHTLASEHLKHRIGAVEAFEARINGTARRRPESLVVWLGDNPKSENVALKASTIQSLHITWHHTSLQSLHQLENMEFARAAPSQSFQIKIPVDDWNILP